MFMVFLLCAVVGGTVMVCQFLMTVLGLGGDVLDVDVSGDLDGIGDVSDVGDVDFDSPDVGDVDAGDLDVDHADSTSGFSIISFRTVVAGMTFFGLGGLGAQAATDNVLIIAAVAVGCGAAAMYAVFWMMRGLYMMKSDGTVHIRNTLGHFGTVYLRVPAARSGNGKVQINVQGRTMEYLAMTAGESLPSGSKIVVTGVVTPTTVEVESAVEEV